MKEKIKSSIMDVFRVLYDGLMLIACPFIAVSMFSSLWTQLLFGSSLLMASVLSYLCLRKFSTDQKEWFDAADLSPYLSREIFIKLLVVISFSLALPGLITEESWLLVAIFTCAIFCDIITVAVDIGRIIGQTLELARFTKHANEVFDILLKTTENMDADDLAQQLKNLINMAREVPDR